MWCILGPQQILAILCRANSTNFTKDLREVLLRFEATGDGHIQYSRIGSPRHRLSTINSLAQNKLMRCLAFVYGHYRYYLLSAENRDWLEECGVPRDLGRNNIADYVREDRSLVVTRHLGWDQPYNGSIHVVPLWDEEHALSLDFRDGAIVSVTLTSPARGCGQRNLPRDNFWHKPKVRCHPNRSVSADCAAR
jgi:hypothetical protein